MNTKESIKTTTPMKNVHITIEYTSENGNTYYVKTKYSNRIAITYNIGIGIAYQYLNGVTIHSWDGEKSKVIAKKIWDGSNPCIFTEEKAQHEAVELLKKYLMQQAELNGTPLAPTLANDLSSKLVNEASKNLTL